MRPRPCPHSLPSKHIDIALHLLLWIACIVYATAIGDEVIEVDGKEHQHHPDPNEENYSGMVYVGRIDDEGKRVGFDADNGTLQQNNGSLKSFRLISYNYLHIRTDYCFESTVILQTYTRNQVYFRYSIR